VEIYEAEDSSRLSSHSWSAGKYRPL